MKPLISLLALLCAVNFSYAQTDIPAPSSAGPLGGGSWLRFTSGTNTSIQEGWGLNLTGDNTHPVKIANASFMVGYTTAGQNTGVNNVLINGNVGIGTDSPTAKLNLAGNSSNYLGADITISRINSLADVGRSPTLQFNDVYTGYGSIIQSYQGQLQFFGDNGNGWKEAMRIMPGGNIGVGTTTPDAKLSVKGTIHTQEIKVDLNGWADYVFKPTYHLPPLSQVKTYIDQNQHLPEIPSEADIKKDGINLGEMNKLLLKKVEELTLYLIEQNKRIEQLEAKTKTQ